MAMKFSSLLWNGTLCRSIAWPNAEVSYGEEQFGVTLKSEFDLARIVEDALPVDSLSV